MTTRTIAAETALPGAKVAPGPKGCMVVGSVPQMRKDAIKLLMESMNKYGDIVRIQLVEYVHMINHPDYIKHVLQDNHTNYGKPFYYDRIRPVVGNGLLTNEGESWLRQRRLAQPAFHKPRLAAMAHMMADATHMMLDSWEAGKKVDVHEEMMKLTMAIVSRALFNIDITREAETVGVALTTCLDIVNDHFQSFFIVPRAVPTPQNIRLNHAIAALDKVVNGIIAERRARPEGHDDLLSMLMAARDEDTGEGMSDAQLRDEVMTLFLAGHETTANALSFAFYLLSTAPPVERRLYQEVAPVTDAMEMTKLPYVTMVFNEAMRLYPPAWLFSRKALKEDVIGGYRIPAGSVVMLCPYTMHRHPGIWENPEGFDPDRFTPENEAKRPKMAFYPFAAGPRMCIGWNFAMMEANIALATILQRFKLNLVPGQRVEVNPSVTLRPANPIMMTLHAR